MIRRARDFGCYIKAMRQKTKMTQVALAAASGVGARFIRELEKGKPSCQLEKALLVAAMLGIKLQMLLPTIRDKSS